MTAPGGPTPDQWKKMSKKQKIFHLIFSGIFIALILAGLFINLFFGVIHF